MSEEVSIDTRVSDAHQNMTVEHEEVLEETRTEEETGDAKSTDEDGEYHAVFVLNIPLTASPDDLKKHFEEWVAVKSVTFLYDRRGKFHGCAIVDLPNKWAFQGACGFYQSQLGSQYLYVVPYKLMSKPQERNEIKQYVLLVKNIPKSINLRDAKQYFFSAGLIRRFTPRCEEKPTKDGFFSDDWSAAIKVNKLETLKAVLDMDGSILGGHSLEIEVQVADTDGVYKSLAQLEPAWVCESSEVYYYDVEDDNSPYRLTVSNLPDSADSEKVKKLLKQVGEVDKCLIFDKASTGSYPKVAVVTMADEESYKKALELSGSVLDETAVKIIPFVKGRKTADPEWLKKPHIVTLSNIPERIHEADLRKHFESAGEVVCIRFPKDRDINAAFIEFCDEDSFEKAINLSNTFIDDHCISVVPISSRLVSKYWLEAEEQREAVKNNQSFHHKRNDNKGKRSKDYEPRFGPPSKKQNQMLGGVSLAAYDRYVTSFGYGGGFHDELNRTAALMEAVKRKEMEQAAMAALSDLQARKMGMGSYGDSSNTYGSGMSSFGAMNTYGAGNSSFGSNYSYSAGSRSFGSNRTYGGGSNFGSNNYRSGNSSSGSGNRYGSSSFDSRNSYGNYRSGAGGNSYSYGSKY